MCACVGVGVGGCAMCVGCGVWVVCEWVDSWVWCVKVFPLSSQEKYVTVPGDVPEVKRDEVAGMVVAGTIPRSLALE